MMPKPGWKCDFKLVISSKDGVSLKEFNDSLDRFVASMIDSLPETGRASPKSAIGSWSGGLDLPFSDEDPEYTF
jgi:hypothetical protein|tara:strand:- start:362 stop:583 length:222 start_codon:yes stop_codon:yes gene_type:complete